MTKTLQLACLGKQNFYSMFNNRGEALDQYRVKEAASIHILIPGAESSQSKQWTELARAQNKMEVSIRIIDPHEIIWIGANPDRDQERHAKRRTKQRNENGYF